MSARQSILILPLFRAQVIHPSILHQSAGRNRNTAPVWVGPCRTTGMTEARSRRSLSGNASLYRTCTRLHPDATPARNAPTSTRSMVELGAPCSEIAGAGFEPAATDVFARGLGSDLRVMIPKVVRAEPLAGQEFTRAGCRPCCSNRYLRSLSPAFLFEPCCRGFPIASFFRARGFRSPPRSVGSIL